MKIVIDHKGIKQEIDGEFMMCGSQETLHAFANAILSEVGRMTGYGWIEIRDPRPLLPMTKNSPPLTWDSQ